ncbi:MAG: S26 family signal peptidase, partial [Methylocella sp.]
LYAITYGSTIRHGSTVLARLPGPVRRFAAERHYLPLNVPLVKRVAGVPGDRICARGATIYRNGEPIAVRRMRDARGRLLPGWTGCRRLGADELFLLNAPADSFDGRYFGITQRADVIGKAHKL